jgi:hypothetical protein
MTFPSPSPASRPLVYYITAHGYGHGVRSCEIIRAFKAQNPEAPVCVVSDLPRTFLENRLHGLGIVYRAASFDVGMVQLDSVRVDVPATLARLTLLDDQWAQRVAQEAQWLRDQHAAMIVADIPAIPIEAAAQAGIPRIAIGNFAWDWIYSAFEKQDARWPGIIGKFRSAYSLTDLLIRLPFAEPMRAFPWRVDVPVPAEPGVSKRDALAQALGCPVDRTWVLLSFTSLDWNEDALNRVRALDDYVFLTVKPLAWQGGNMFAVDRDRFSFQDVLASSDIVLTKPGFGILSECIANQKPMVYVDRADFLEYPVLEKAVQKYLKHAHVPAPDLYAGHLAHALEAVQTCPEPAHRIPTGGGPAAAHLIKAFYSA